MSHVGGGWLRVPYPELSIPFLLSSEMTAQLQQRSVTHRLIHSLLLILDAIACIFHEAPLLPFFFYLPMPKSPPLALHLV